MISPSKILCVARNYVAHIQELDNEIPTQPALFMKPPSAIADDICYNAIDSIHYESELCFIIRDGKLGEVGFGLDLTKREIQTQLKAKGLPWERAKAFDGSAVFSDFVAHAGDIKDLRLELFINDELVQQGGCELMLYQPEEILSEIQSFCTLVDGDIIMTGTPNGVGEIHKGDKFVGKIFSKHHLLIEKLWIVK
jgi:2-keto-4-pentenoate hydratase/2-oxohepta-3-ene-1,7-dioic acid hydratase in catechol pathway